MMIWRANHAWMMLNPVVCKKFISRVAFFFVTVPLSWMAAQPAEQDSRNTDPTSQGSSTTRPANVFLRVKRPRREAAGNDVSDSDRAGYNGPEDRVTIRCRDLQLDSHEVAAESISGRRYTFVRILKDHSHLPAVVSSNTETAHNSTVVAADEKGNACSTEGDKGRETMEQALHQLDLHDDSATTSVHKGVKALPSAAECALKSRERSLRQAQRTRAAFRCERIGKLRHNNAICIDVALVDCNTTDESGGDVSVVADTFFYDLYVLKDEDEDEEQWEHDTATDADTSEAAWEEACAAVFDDSDDEYSFDVKRTKHHYAVDRRQRQQLRCAQDFELLSVPAKESWLQYSDTEGLMLLNGTLLADDARPEGLDNYVYFDHRLDDEYDSNAEDHAGNDYPDESVSGSDGSSDGGGRDGGDSDGTFGNCRCDDEGDGDDDTGYQHRFHGGDDEEGCDDYF